MTRAVIWIGVIVPVQPVTGKKSKSESDERGNKKPPIMAMEASMESPKFPVMSTEAAAMKSSMKPSAESPVS